MKDWAGKRVRVADYVTQSGHHWWEIWPVVGEEGEAGRTTKAGFIIVALDCGKQMSIPPGCLEEIIPKSC